MMKKIFKAAFFGLIVASGVVITGCSDGDSVDTTSVDTTSVDTTSVDTTSVDTTSVDTTSVDGNPSNGKNRYIIGQCAVCHGFKGETTPNIDFASMEYQELKDKILDHYMPRADEDHKYLGSFEDLRDLTDEDIADISAYIVNWNK